MVPFPRHPVRTFKMTGLRHKTIGQDRASRSCGDWSWPDGVAAAQARANQDVGVAASSADLADRPHQDLLSGANNLLRAASIARHDEQIANQRRSRRQNRWS